MTSGKAINRPSDSPTGIVSVMSLNRQIASNEQFSKNAADGAAWLGNVDTTLQTVNARLQRVRDLVLQASSTGSSDATARQAIATEVTSLRGEMVGLSNTNYAGRPLFGGTTSSATAYDPSDLRLPRQRRRDHPPARLVDDGRGRRERAGRVRRGVVVGVRAARRHRRQRRSATRRSWLATCRPWTAGCRPCCRP